MKKFAEKSCNFQPQSYNQTYNHDMEGCNFKKDVDLKEKNNDSCPEKLLKSYNQSYNHDGNDVWLTRKEVEELLGVSYEAVNKACRKGKFKTIISTGRGGKRYLIALSSLPPEARLKYMQEQGMLEPCLLQAPAPIVQTPTVQAPEKYKKIALAKLDLVRLWREFRNGAGKKTEADRAFLKAYNSRALAPNIYEILGEVSLTSLYRWIDQLEGTDDWVRLIPKWNPGSNGYKLTKVEEDAVLRFLLDPKQIKIGYAIRLAKFWLKQKGIESEAHPITFRRFVDKWKSQNYDKWVLAREGQKALKDTLIPFIRRHPESLEVGDVLVADGHRLNFQVINPFTGKPCRAVLVGYLDWKSFALVGYEVMLEENIQCIASALRNAIIRLGKFPKLTYQDNGKAFRARFFTGSPDFNESGLYGLFARLGIGAEFAMPYNARAKVIERWFQEFTETFEKLIPSYVGSSIAKKPAYLLRNEKFHKALHREYIPTIEETIQLIEAWLDFDYSQPCPHVNGKTKGEVLNEGRGSGVDINLLDDLMMEEKISTINRNGIRFLRAEYWNEALFALREQVIIKYSLFDLSCIKVYDLKGNFICEAERRMPVNPMARHLGDARDMEELKRQIAEQRRLERKAKEGLKEILSLRKEIAVDWQKVSERAPKVVDELIREGVELQAVEERIPDEAVKTNNAGAMPQTKFEATSETPERPFFGENMIARYEWHMKHGFRTQEDLEFKEYFESTPAYRMMKQFWDREQEQKKWAAM